MKKHLIYDLPTRIFHWLFSGLFVVAFLIAKTVDDDNPVFSYHMLAGLLLAALVLLRVLWGVIGTHYARFSSFALKPAELVQYLKGVFSGDKKIWAGHNPASSWATLIMLVLALMLAISGALMTTGYKETFEDAHELFANAFLITVLLHIAGVFLHTFRYQDNISLSMIHGHKQHADIRPEVVSQKPFFAFTFVLIMAIITGYILKNYNSQNRELQLFGTVLHLGETEKDNEKENE